jgi:sugar phosphate isomerase/epimerase
MIPFAGKIDFSAIIAALKAVNYQGYLTLEADTYLKAFPADTAFEGIRNLAAAANRLQIMYEDKQ